MEGNIRLKDRRSSCWPAHVACDTRRVWFYGVDHIVEVAFGANIDADVEMLRMGGSIGAYASDNATPKIPFWLMVFKNIRLFCLGSDDFPNEAKIAAEQDQQHRT
jgi:NADPH:quinone reductase-like Zn-dependent oxidoreductase